MKVLFISRATLFQDKGGDTIQMLNTAQELRNLGIEVDIRLCNEHIGYASYDLVHFFNIIRPADILYHIRKSSKPFTVSTIYVDYSEYEKKARKGIMGFVFKKVSPDLIEYIKVIARSILKKERIISPEYLFLGQYRSIRKIIKKSAMLLPNSHSEYRRLKAHYRLDHSYRLIPNAIDPTLFGCLEVGQQKDLKMVLCVGRIEGRKNQLNLIKALRGTDFKLKLIGSVASNQISYYNKCREEASENVEFIDNLPQEQILAYYRRAKVHVLPSWFETTGLSSLEAAAMGCNIVITDKGDTRDYFENMAFYCDPDSIDSIRKSIEQASSADFNESLRSKIYLKYTWKEAASETLKAYEQVLSKKVGE